MTRSPAAPAVPAPAVPDATDRVLHQWARVRPDLDVSSVAIISRLGRLRAIIAEEQEAVFAEYGVTNPTFTMLVTLVRINQPGGISQRRLANEMGLTPGTVSARVDRLVADGLVMRSPDPADGRGSLVTLTGRGRELFEAAVPAHLANQVRLLGSLSTEEQATLAGLLDRPGLLVRSADENSPAAAAGLGEGDILTAAGGTPLRSVSGLYAAISDALPTGRLELRVRRGLKDRSVSVLLDAAAAVAAPAPDGLAARTGEHRV
jgi:DNA-binding MarR family transcriptional regulator